MNHLLSLGLLIAITYYGSVQTGHSDKGYIGILYNPVGHKVVKVYKDSPAAKAGLLPGDIVKYVNDKDIVGPCYTKINLTIKRGNETFSVVIERIPNEYIDRKHAIEDKSKDSVPSGQNEWCAPPQLSKVLPGSETVRSSRVHSC
jgi:membrane-associated protease RseP (regulator of RpoE activity)